MDNQVPKVKTLQDIAQMAGVSRSTVSRALQNSPLISKDTRERVQAIARAHNYQPNLLARNLRLQQTQTIAFIIPVAPKDSAYLSDPFLLKFIGLVNTELQTHGYDMLISQPMGDVTNIGERYLDTGRADGMILMGRSTATERFLANARPEAPIILWGPPQPGESFCAVGIDNVAAAREAVDHLLTQGRRRIGFIGTENNCLEAVHRQQGYMQALDAAGIPIDEAWLAPGDYSGRSGYEGMMALIEQAPDLDAVFAISDVLALGAMEALRTVGRRVPEDVAIIGFDNIPQGAYNSPPLTTVSQNLAGQGAKLLVEKLLNQIAGQEANSVIVPYQLIVRRSSEKMV